MKLLIFLLLSSFLYFFFFFFVLLFFDESEGFSVIFLIVAIDAELGFLLYSGEQAVS